MKEVKEVKEMPNAAKIALSGLAGALLNLGAVLLFQGALRLSLLWRLRLT